jgi:hypothetical protein
MEWLNRKLPNVKALDVNWTMERYDFTEEARQYIFDNWIKVSDDNGGYYQEPSYYEERQNMIIELDLPVAPSVPDEDIIDLNSIPIATATATATAIATAIEVIVIH